jgi:ABC-2 type transport system permease protein
MSAADLAATAAPARVRRSRPGTFLASELKLVFGRRRNQLALLVLAGPPLLIATAVKVQASRPERQAPDFFGSITQNGLFVALAALTIEMGLLLPLATSLVAGDSVAGEAHGGTLRYLLTVPVGRTRLLLVKLAAIAAYVVAGTFLIAAVGMVAGVAMFGGGQMVTLSGSTLGMTTGVVRVLLAAAYLAVGLCALGAVGLFFSTLTEQPLAAMLVTVVFSTVSFILDTIPQVDWLHPYLISHHWTAYVDLFRDPVDLTNVGHGLYLAVAYGVVAFLAARARFLAKDVTS